jgi:hypothetical protein
MPRYKYVDRSRGVFLTVRLDERLLSGAFEFAPDYLIDRMDLTSPPSTTTAAALPPRLPG